MKKGDKIQVVADRVPEESTYIKAGVIYTAYVNTPNSSFIIDRADSGAEFEMYCLFDGCGHLGGIAEWRVVSE